MMEVVQTHIIPTREAIDEDVLRGITSLGCFKDRERLVDALLESNHNTGEAAERLTSRREREQGARLWGPGCGLAHRAYK